MVTYAQKSRTLTKAAIIWSKIQ